MTLSDRLEPTTGEMASHTTGDDEKTRLRLVLDCKKDRPQEASVCKTVTGYTLSFLFAVSTVISSACAQALGGIIPVFQLNFWRFLTTFLLSLMVIILARQTLLPEKKHWPWIAVLALAVSGYNVFFYTASLYVSLGTLGGLSPSFVVIIIALETLVFSRDCSLDVTAAVVFCVTGVLLIAQPDFVFSYISTFSNTTEFYNPVCKVESEKKTCWNGIVDGALYTGFSQNNTYNMSVDVQNPHHQDPDVSNKTNEVKGYVLLVLGAVSFSVFNVLINKKIKDCNSFLALTWIAGSSTALSGLLMGIFEDLLLPDTSVCGLLLAGHALGAGAGALPALIAMQMINPLVFSIIHSSGVPMMFLGQYTVMRNIYPGKQNYLEIVGAVFVLFGIIISPLYKLFTQTRKKESCT